MSKKLKQSLERIYEKEDPWNIKDNHYTNDKHKKVINLVKKNKPSRVLELGCGEGILAKELAPHIHYLEAIDISATAVKRARKYCRDVKNVKFYCTDVADFTYQPNQYSMIIAMDVFSYIISDNTIFDLGLLVEKMIRSLKKNGKMIILNVTKVISPDGSRNELEYYDWARKSYFTIIKELGMIKESHRKYYGIKNNKPREYEIIVFSKL